MKWAASMVRLAVLLALAGGALRATAGEASKELPRRGDVALFTFFRDNGQDGLFLAWSTDALAWREIPYAGRSHLTPEIGTKLMRDPCLRRGGDGTYHLVWTTGWNDRVIGHASSKDLRHWSPQQAIPVMEHEPEARNAWAPELHWDAGRREFLIFWATTIPGRFPATEGSSEDRYNHRIYGVRTKDFVTFTPASLFYDGGFNVIDATLAPVGRRVALVVKDETLRPERKHLRIAWAEDPRGPFGPAGTAFSGSWVEGPSVLKWGGAWWVYFDHYAKPQYYGVMRTRDWKRWEDLSPRLQLPAGVRHGTALSVPARLVRALIDP